MICLFLLLKAPGSSSKRFENSPASVKVRFGLQYNTGKNELVRSVGAFPGFYCPPTQWSPASAIARRRCPTPGAEFLGKCYS